jgi:uncharacterized phage protein (TIGR02218 family)
MKTLPPGLAAHLESGATTLCWCWKLIRRDGVSLGFTDHDRTLAFAGTDFEPSGGFTASEIRAGSDLGVDAQDAEGVLSSDRITETDIIDGCYDGAEVEVWRVNWRDTDERVLMRRGVIGEIRRGRTAFTAEMRSLSHLLDQPVGRSFQYACDRALGDDRCRVDLATPAYAGAGAVIDTLGDRAFITGGLGAFAEGWFANGLLTWTAGANAGRVAEVMLHAKDVVVTLTLLEAPVRGIAAGDAFTLFAGCDKTAATCASKFANIANFRGFPHIPGQDTVLRYAKPGAANSGEPL